MKENNNMQFSLTKQQQGLWFDYKLNPNSDSYNTFLQLHFKSGLDVTRFRKSLSAVLNFFPAYRTKFFETKSGEVKQIISSNLESDYFELEDISHNVSGDQSGYDMALQYMQTKHPKPFNLEIDVPFRVYLVKYSNQGYVFTLMTHHIITDGISTSNLYEAIILAYNHSDDIEKILLQKFNQSNVGDYLLEYNQPEYQNKINIAKNYWQERLRNSSLTANIYDRTVDFSMKEHKLSLGKTRYELIKKYAKNCKTTPFIVIATLYSVLLYRYFRQKDMTMGYPVNIRPSDLKNIFGFYVSVFPFRVQINGKETFKELITKITREQKQDRDYLQLSLDQIVGLMSNYNKAKDFNIYVGQTLFTCNTTFKMNNVEMEVKTFQASARNDLNFLYDPQTEELDCKIGYNSNIFTSEIISAFTQNYCHLLDIALTQNDQEAIDNIDYLSVAEKQNLLFDFNNTDINYPKNKCIHSLFAEQALKTPDNIAVVFEDQKLTYQQLNHKSNQLAHHLQSLGVKTDVTVGICVERSLEMIIAIMAILKAGGAYVPLDPNYPEDRLQYMIKDSEMKIILAQSKLQEKLQIIKKQISEIIYLDQIYEKLTENLSEESPITSVKPNNLAYIVYTSGSTGKPKGVMIEHSSVVRLVKGQNYVPLDETTVMMQISTILFDAATFEIHGALLNGGTLVIYPYKVIDYNQISEVVRKNHINTMFLTSALFVQMVLNLNDDVSDFPIKYLLTGGEIANQNAFKNLHQNYKNINIIHVYGPTENTTFTTFYNYEKQGENKIIPIGAPISNTKIYILDQNLNLVPIGIAGEIHIAGDGLARGYLNRPDLTAEKFIPNPFQTLEDKQDKTRSANGRNDRLYKSGDLARWLPDGNIEYLGRVDNQVKIRGFRIELGEIENCLNQYPHIKESVVIVKTNSSGEPGQLIAYYITDQSSLDVIKLKNHLKQKLPDYMIPAGFIAIDKIPITPNGKTDRKFLEQKDVIIEGDKEYKAPKSEIEKKLVAIWQRVLNNQKVGVQDNFFDIGGHSLLVVKLAQNIKRELQYQITVTDIFTHPTIEHLVNFITKQNENDHIKSQPLVSNSSTTNSHDIAVIGMACRFPGANNVEEFWHNLKEGKEGIKFFTEAELKAANVDEQDYKNENYVAAKGYVDDAKTFDAEFFGYNPREAEILDPQQRLFLEEAYHTLEDAGYDPYNYQGKIGVYAGSGINNYRSLAEEGLGAKNVAINYQIMLGNGADFLCSRVTYKLNLTGPAVVIQTGCSTSLVAIYQACRAIMNGDCDMALAGGVSLQGGFDKSGYYYQPGMILSKDGHCRPFDDAADGTVPGQGVGLVLLKPLSKAVADGDNIRAVIKGGAINNDGSLKVSYAAPSVFGQQSVIKMAQQAANIDASKISYVETHGTATIMGDPIEIEALSKAFKNGVKNNISPKNSCAIGSVKSNIGHTDAAAGVASFIKTVLCLQHKTLVPTLHYQKANSEIDFSNTPFYVNTKTKEWPSENNNSRCAAVSSFGIGGTNAHIILEEFSENAPQKISQNISSGVLIPLSAKNPEQLKNYARKILSFIKENEIDLASFAYTLQTGRAAFEERLIILATNFAEIENCLQEFLQDEKSSGNWWFGSVKADKIFAVDAALQEKISTWISNKKWPEIAEYWTSGYKMDFASLYQIKPKKIALPTYPFAKNIHWIDVAKILKTYLKLTDAKTILTDDLKPESAIDSKILREKTLQNIKQIIGDIIKLSPEKIDDNQPLESYGVDSITMIDLKQKLAEIFGEIPGSLLLEYKTLSKLTDYFISKKPDQSLKLAIADVQNKIENSKPVISNNIRPINKFPELIHLNQINEGQPIFWFHAALGSVEPYYIIAQKMKRPFYGIQARGFASDRLPLNGIQAMASYYIYIIKSIQPEGPYDLGGYSLGGTIAYEITRQLQELGDEVSSIVMLDTTDNCVLNQYSQISKKSAMLQAVNFELATLIITEPEKFSQTLIHRDQINSALADDIFLTTLFDLAQMRGLSKTKIQMEKQIDKIVMVQQAYEMERYLPGNLENPKLRCYFFRNKSGLLYGALEPYFLLDDKLKIDYKNYWIFWQKKLPKIEIIDVDSSNHMVLLSEQKSYDKIVQFCIGLYV